MFDQFWCLGSLQKNKEELKNEGGFCGGLASHPHVLFVSDSIGNPSVLATFQDVNSIFCGDVVYFNLKNSARRMKPVLLTEIYSDGRQVKQMERV